MPPPRVEEIDPDFLKILKQQYNIIDIIAMNNFDYRFDQLKDRLETIKKSEFDCNDRIIIMQFDTDYYIHNQYGINLLNLFTIWKAVDLPLYTMLFYTNTHGIKNEIDFICQQYHSADRPTVIETFINPTNYSNDTYIIEPDLCVEQIEYHGMSLLGGAYRSHRFAVYNHLKHLAKKLVLVIRAPK